MYMPIDMHTCVYMGPHVSLCKRYIAGTSRKDSRLGLHGRGPHGLDSRVLATSLDVSCE